MTQSSATLSFSLMWLLLLRTLPIEFPITIVLADQNVLIGGCSIEDHYDDACETSFDLTCDADGVRCPLGSDCFDCDPCRRYVLDFNLTNWYLPSPLCVEAQNK